MRRQSLGESASEVARSRQEVVLVVEAWTTLIGAISLEVFGHWRKTVLQPELVFEDSVRRLGESLGLGPR